MTNWIGNISKLFLTAAFLLLGSNSYAVTVKVTPIERDGQVVNLVEVGTLPSFVVENPSDENLSGKQKQKIAEVRRDIFTKTVRALIASSIEAPVLVTDGGEVITSKNTKAKSQQYDIIDEFKDTVSSDSWTGDSEEQLKRARLLRERAAALLVFIWDSVVRSTFTIAKDFYKHARENRSPHEFGFSMVVRGEFQIGMGNKAVMKNVARGIDVGYDFYSHELVFRRMVRAEHMGDGVALSAGPKIEMRAYQANLEALDRSVGSTHHTNGKSWYPPAIPCLSVAIESRPGFTAAGLMLAGNIFEMEMPFIPLYLANTVNDFEADYKVTRIILNPIRAAKFTIAFAKRWLQTHGYLPRRTAHSVGMCRALFIDGI